MDKQRYPGPSQMVKIDGARVRSLREAKKLTQLYIATVVGVTTDTISRWENKRYPSIKEENALKLADALEVSLENILEEEGKGEKDTTAPEGATQTLSHSKPPRSGRIILWILSLVIILLVPFVWYHLKQPAPVFIFATRLLPPHIPEGQTIPVIIRVETKQEGPFSLILREKLPQGYEPVASAPLITGFDKKNGSIRWLARTSGRVTTFVYLARKVANGPETSGDAPLNFSGTVTLGDKKSAETAIAGSQVLPLADYHWADANSDNRIDDSEILAAYDTFSALDNVKYDWQELDEIWSGTGYYWDGKKREYIIQH